MGGMVKDGDAVGAICELRWLPALLGVALREAANPDSGLSRGAGPEGLQRMQCRPGPVRRGRVAGGLGVAGCRRPCRQPRTPRAGCGIAMPFAGGG